MKNLFRIFLVFSLVSGCRNDTSKPPSPMIQDPHSAAVPAEAVVTHSHFKLNLDFAKKEIQGQVRITLRRGQGVPRLRLDTRNLTIESVWLGKEGNETPFRLDSARPFLGQALEIQIGDEGEQTVWVNYRTTSGSEALQWLEPSQTEGKKHPFLFTQGQAILSRTWFPCQDSPGIRFRWSAEVTLPPALQAVMSAGERTSDSAAGVYRFTMDQPVPAYLIALGAGNLRFRKLDDRTGVFAEPEMLERSAWEFADMGKMLAAAENLYGQYRWGRYDVLVLPPSFPFGGMENPCVTFATPTILAGDRSLVSLIAHELAHSWSGNLVTNATWDDFWLNEGFTVYFERRIMEALEGKEYADMLAVIGHQDLLGTLDDLKEDKAATCLKLNLTGRDPDDGMNDIAYEKGCLFLLSLEAQVGRERWDVFLKTYFEYHAFQSLTTEGFLTYLEQRLLKPSGISLEKSGAKEWIYKPGLPGGTAAPVSRRFEAVSRLADAFAETGSVPSGVTRDWSSHEWLHFLRSLSPRIRRARMAALDSEFDFTRSRNSEILFEWLMLSVKCQYLPAWEALERFLVHTGRRKFVLPLYKELVKTTEGKDFALRVFAEAGPNYHAVTRGSVAEVLK